jgi:hypothetical protein
MMPLKKQPSPMDSSVLKGALSHTANNVKEEDKHGDSKKDKELLQVNTMLPGQRGSYFPNSS